MKKKKKKAFKAVFDRSTVIVLLICIIAMLLLGTGVLADRVIKGRTDNVVSSGVIKTKLINVMADGSEMPEEIYSLLPGQVIDNVVSAKNTGEYPEYVRIKLSPVINDRDGTEMSAEDIHFEINSADWTYKDGYYYYNNELKAFKDSTPLYEKIKVGTNIGNEYRYATLTVLIELDAVQVANNKTPLEAEGWVQVVSPDKSIYEN